MALVQELGVLIAESVDLEVRHGEGGVEVVTKSACEKSRG
jgi:hypothetical protein